MGVKEDCVWLCQENIHNIKLIKITKTHQEEYSKDLVEIKEEQYHMLMLKKANLLSAPVMPQTRQPHCGFIVAANNVNISSAEIVVKIKETVENQDWGQENEKYYKPKSFSGN